MSTLLLTGAGTAGIAVFDPSSVATLVGWWKADAITGLNDGDAIGTWTDSSTGGHNLTQATAAFKPLYKTGIQNSLPVVRFDGSNDQVAATFTRNQADTWFVVAKYRTAYSANSTILDGAASAFSHLVGRRSSTQIGIYAGTTVLNVTTTPEAWHVYAGIYNGASSEVRADGGTATTGNAGATNAGGVILGAAGPPGAPQEYGAVDIGEVLIYSGALSSANRALVEAYLRGKWSTP